VSARGGTSGDGRHAQRRTAPKRIWELLAQMRSEGLIAGDPEEISARSTVTAYAAVTQTCFPTWTAAAKCPG